MLQLIVGGNVLFAKIVRCIASMRILTMLVTVISLYLLLKPKMLSNYESSSHLYLETIRRYSEVAGYEFEEYELLGQTT